MTTATITEPQTEGSTVKKPGGLSKEFIADLMANNRTRNMYGPKLIDWINNSDEPGVNPAEAWPVEFGKKSPATLYQGFRNAAEKANLFDQILIIKRDDSVFLIHKERYALVAVAEAESADE